MQNRDIPFRTGVHPITMIWISCKAGHRR
nr:unnamed protein product [Callosobruchus analis]